MKPIAHPYILEIESYKPGKSKAGNHAHVIKLSSNENALGTSPKAVEAYKKHAGVLHHYANGTCAYLREALAEKFEIDAEKIVCGAGSDEIIALLAYAYAGVGDEIIYSQYGFLMYPIAAMRVGAKAVQVKEKNYKADVDAILAAITPKTKIIFIANPNNPTGSYLTKEELQKLIDHTPKNIVIGLDHAYEEFVDLPDYPNGLEIVNKHQNVVLMKTFSKIYGLASLRIGYSYSSLEIADALNKTRGPFNVSGAAQAAALAALKDEEFFDISKKHNAKWLGFMLKELAKFSQIKVIPSITNFILIDFGSKEFCEKVNQRFMEEGIILREVGAYGLSNCLRITIGKEEENLAVLKVLKDIFN